MNDLLLPALYATLAWWASTGLLFYLDRLPRGTHRWSLLGATLVMLAAFLGLALSRNETSVRGAYLAFSCAILVWGWLELLFLTGTVTGSRRHGCAPGCSGVAHFGHATAAIAYHELSIFIAAAAVLALTWAQPNPIGGWTFLLLWAMRLSAKLNLFFGVRNPGTELLPPHLRYLGSYFRRRALNPLLPVSLIAGTVAVVLLVAPAVAAGASAYDVAGRALLGTLAALGVIEHAFLVLPISVGALWRLQPDPEPVPEAAPQAARGLTR